MGTLAVLSVRKDDGGVAGDYVRLRSLPCPFLCHEVVKLRHPPRLGSLTGGTGVTWGNDPHGCEGWEKVWWGPGPTGAPRCPVVRVLPGGHRRGPEGADGVQWSSIEREESAWS